MEPETQSYSPENREREAKSENLYLEFSCTARATERSERCLHTYPCNHDKSIVEAPSSYNSQSGYTSKDYEKGAPRHHPRSDGCDYGAVGLVGFRRIAS